MACDTVDSSCAWYGGMAMISRFLRRFFYCIFLALLFLPTCGCDSLFFYPKKQLYDNVIAQSFSPKDISFITADKITLHGWWFDTQPPARGTILVLHGNAENLSTHVNGVLWLIKEGFNIFIFDYRGFGRSQGSPSIAGVHRDAQAALQTALTLSGVAGGRVAVLGQSIGGAIAIYMVAHAPDKSRIAAVLVDSAFASYRLIAREKLAGFFLTWPFQYPLSYLVSDSYSPIRWIKDVSPVPLMIIHGRNDPVVPLEHGEMLYNAALTPKEFLITAEPGHIQSFADTVARNEAARFFSDHLELAKKAYPQPVAP